jgi:hypothetical protein
MSKPILKREFTLSKVEAIKWQFNTAINTYGSVINETQLYVLAYVYVYGYREGKKKLVSDRVFTSKNSVVNYITTLKDMGYLVRSSEGMISINPNLKIYDEDFVVLHIVHVDQENYDIEHPYYKREVRSRVS